jgi:MFS family permease
MNGAGGAAGTLLGGVITQELSWRWVLLINLPIGIVTACVAWVAVHEWRDENQTSFDLAGALTVTAGLLAFVYGIVSAGQHGWGSTQALVPIAISLALIALFLLIEARFATAPLVPLRIFSGRLLRSANGVVMLMSAAIFPMWFFASLYLQEVLRWGPLDTGLAFLPMALTIMACGTLAGGFVGRFGAGRVLTTGLVLLAAGLALFARVSVGGSYVTEFLPASVLIALGVGLAIVPSTIAATATAAPSEAGLVSGLVNTSRQMGGAIGLALLATFSVEFAKHLIEVDYRAPLLAVNDGFRLAFALAAVCAAAAAVVSWLFIARRTPAPHQPDPKPVARVVPSQAPAPAPAAAAPAAAPPAAAPPESAPAQQGEPPTPPPAADPAPPRAAAAHPTVRLTSATGGAWPLGAGACTLSYARRTGA